MFTKEQFYKMIKPEAKNPAYISTYMHFDKHYTLNFGLANRTDEKVIVDCQLINRNTDKTYTEKYICADLHIDCIKQGITSDYKLFNFLEKHYAKAIAEYEDKFPQWR